MAGLSSLYNSLYILAQTIVGLALIGIGGYLVHEDGKSTFSRLFLLFGIVWFGIGFLGVLTRWLKISLVGLIFFLCVCLLSLFQIALFIAFTFFNTEFIDSVNNTQGGSTNNVNSGIDFLQANRPLVSIILASAAGFETLAAISLWKSSKSSNQDLP